MNALKNQLLSVRNGETAFWWLMALGLAAAALLIFS